MIPCDEASTKNSPATVYGCPLGNITISTIIIKRLYYYYIPKYSILYLHIFVPSIEIEK